MPKGSLNLNGVILKVADDPQRAGVSLYKYPCATGSNLLFSYFTALLRVATQWLPWLQNGEAVRSLVRPIFFQTGWGYISTPHTVNNTPHMVTTKLSTDQSFLARAPYITTAAFKKAPFSCIKPTFVIFFCQNNKIFA